VLHCLECRARAQEDDEHDDDVWVYGYRERYYADAGADLPAYDAADVQAFEPTQPEGLDADDTSAADVLESS
jgi:hypothetical protein